MTVIGPVCAPAGAVALSSTEETRVTAAALVPLNLTVELLLNPIPVIVTTVPAAPCVGLKLLIDRVGVNFVALVPVPAGVVTAIGACTAPSGTTALSCVPDPNVTDGDASAPNFTLAPGAKCVPLIVTDRPVFPDDGENEVTVGGLWTR